MMDKLKIGDGGTLRFAMIEAEMGGHPSKPFKAVRVRQSVVSRRADDESATGGQ